MAILRLKDMREMSSEQRLDKINELRTELARLKTMVAAGGSIDNPTQIYEMRKTIAKKCSEVYNIEMLPEEITDCDGCKANTGRFFNGCNECSIQKCAITKTFESCGLCDVFPCEILEQHFQYDPSSKTRLEEVRWQLHI